MIGFKRFSPYLIVKHLHHRTKEIEESLKQLNTANQAKRNEIANEHALLARSSSTQEQLAAGSKRLKEKLVALAGSQRKLLACLTCQKQITSKLKKLTDEDNSITHNTSLEQASMSHRPTITRPDLPADNGLCMTETSHMTGQGLLQQAQSHSVSVLAQQRPHSDLAEPVPLDTLIQHGFLQPGNGCLSCTLMVCYSNIQRHYCNLGIFSVKIFCRRCMRIKHSKYLLDM